MLEDLQYSHGRFRCRSPSFKEFRQRCLAGDPEFVVVDPTFRVADMVGCDTAWVGSSALGTLVCKP